MALTAEQGHPGRVRPARDRHRLAGEARWRCDQAHHRLTEHLKQHKHDHHSRRGCCCSSAVVVVCSSTSPESTSTATVRSSSASACVAETSRTTCFAAAAPGPPRAAAVCPCQQTSSDTVEQAVSGMPGLIRESSADRSSVVAAGTRVPAASIEGRLRGTGHTWSYPTYRSALCLDSTARCRSRAPDGVLRAVRLSTRSGLAGTTRPRPLCAGHEGIPTS